MHPSTSVLAALLAGTLAGACGGTEPGGVLVGESAHFRLFVSPGAKVPPGLEGEAALSALETNWSDTATLLALPAGRIEYHWVSRNEVASTCDVGFHVEGCVLEGPIVVTSRLPHQHELNHAYLQLLTHAFPLPLVREGIAEAIGCGQGAGVRLDDHVRWRDVVNLVPAETGTEALFERGALLARHLIRTRGVEAYLDYYRQAPEVRDPARFADNFSRYWGESVDEVWSAMNTAGPGDSPYDGPICPCSLPSLPVDGAEPLPRVPATTPYWTIPDLKGKTIAFRTPSDARLRVFDCHGKKIDDTVASVAGLVRLDAGVRGYVLAPLESAATGDFISDSCTGAAPFVVPGDLPGHLLAVQFPSAVAAAGTLFLQLETGAGATTLAALWGSVSACATCAFDAATCQPGTPVALPPGTSYVALPPAGSPASDAAIVSNALSID